MTPDLAVNLALTVWALASVVFLTFVEGFTVWARVPTISERLQWLGEHVKLVRASATIGTVLLLVHFFYPGL